MTNSLSLLLEDLTRILDFNGLWLLVSDLNHWRVMYTSAKYIYNLYFFGE